MSIEEPDEDAVIREAARVAANKGRHFGTPQRVIVTPEMIGAIRPPDDSYCKVCEYPLDITAPGGCRFCYEQGLRQKEKLNQQIEMMGGRKAWEDYTLANYRVLPYNEDILRAIQRFDRRTQNLFLFGPKGTGKSHAAAIVKRPLILAGAKVLTVSMPQVMDEVLAGIKGGAFATLTVQWLKTLTMAPVLNLEDIAVEKPSDHAIGFYYKFINQRYLDKRAGMIVTSNYSLPALEERWGAADPQGRVVSRLKEMCRNSIHSFVGLPDFREEGA